MSSLARRLGSSITRRRAIAAAANGRTGKNTRRWPHICKPTDTPLSTAANTSIRYVRTVRRLCLFQLPLQAVTGIPRMYILIDGLCKCLSGYVGTFARRMPRAAAPKLYYVAAAAAAVEGNKEAFVQSDAKSARQVQSDPLNSSSCCCRWIKFQFKCPFFRLKSFLTR